MIRLILRPLVFLMRNGMKYKRALYILLLGIAIAAGASAVVPVLYGMVLEEYNLEVHEQDMKDLAVVVERQHKAAAELQKRKSDEERGGKLQNNSVKLCTDYVNKIYPDMKYSAVTPHWYWTSPDIECYVYGPNVYIYCQVDWNSCLPAPWAGYQGPLSNTGKRQP